MTSSSFHLRAVFGAILLGATSSVGTGCVCPPPAGHIDWVPIPSSGDGPAALAIDCERACGRTEGCARKVYADGTPGIECGFVEPFRSCGMGRRPLGLAPARRTRALRRGRRPGRRATEAKLLAEFAMLEGASVGAFDELADRLDALGAPPELAQRARGAAVEEARHARVMRGLARRAGARSLAIRVTPPPPPTLLELAISNAVEGCVLETFGALLAHRQARTATDRRHREAMEIIAEEETTHAILARDIDAWARTVLDAADVAALDAAHRGAWRTLGRPVAVSGVRTLGWPDGAERARLARALELGLHALPPEPARIAR